MAANTGKLAGKTLFISGASRGIGKAIAIKAARDGANIVIAAKTAEPHSTLPGTIYTAAEEIKAAGGQAFPCIVDIRSEEQVKDAVKQAVSKFGGIDILVNNASAISRTGTLQTPMKKYDLMNAVNARGTYLCSQACLPYLLKSENPHILNISPPLNMSAKWFQGHVAYTMAKYGMSMCALGMAEEFRDEGVAVNTLWPRTLIWTAATEFIGGDGMREQCRSADIMSDAAYVILTKNSREFTGHFCVDDEILLSVGVSDLSSYSCVPGAKLAPDYFLNGGPEELNRTTTSTGAQSPFDVGGVSSGIADSIKTIADAFSVLQSILSSELVEEIGTSYQFDLSGSEEGTWYLDLKSGHGSSGQGPLEDPDCIVKLDSDLFKRILKGKANPSTAFMMGKLKIKGDIKATFKLETFMKRMRKSYKAKL